MAVCLGERDGRIRKNLVLESLESLGASLFLRETSAPDSAPNSRETHMSSAMVWILPQT